MPGSEVFRVQALDMRKALKSASLSCRAYAHHQQQAAASTKTERADNAKRKLNPTMMSETIRLIAFGMRGVSRQTNP